MKIAQSYSRIWKFSFFSNTIASREPQQTLLPFLSIIQLLTESFGSLHTSTTEGQGCRDFSLKESLTNYVHNNGVNIPRERLSGGDWKLDSEEKLVIMDKIDKIGKPIKKIPSIEVRRGVTTGYNPAFIIDGETRKALIRKDIGNKKLIKPLLQGRNIKKWCFVPTDTFLINTYFDIDIPEKFPSIFEHLKNHKQALIRRDDQGRDWWNLRACTYYEEFEKEKIIWGLTADKWAFAYDDKKNFLPSNGYILTSKAIPIKLILAQLNCKLLEFYFEIVGIMTAGGAYTLKYETVIDLPLKYNTKYDAKIVNCVDQILVLTKDSQCLEDSDKQTKIQRLEEEIDNLVYELYGLTTKEIEIIEQCHESH